MSILGEKLLAIYRLEVDNGKLIVGISWVQYENEEEKKISVYRLTSEENKECFALHYNIVVQVRSLIVR